MKSEIIEDWTGKELIKEENFFIKEKFGNPPAPRNFDLADRWAYESGLRLWIHSQGLDEIVTPQSISNPNSLRPFMAGFDGGNLARITISRYELFGDLLAEKLPSLAYNLGVRARTAKLSQSSDTSGH